jgi:MFS family permease
MFADPGQRQVAIGIWITSFSAGGAVGPVLGGVLLERFWRGAVFLLALPVMALLLVLGPRVLPEYRDPAAGRLDLPSAALSLVAVLAVVFGLKLSAQDGLGGLPAAAVLVGLVVGVGFVRRQRRLADPMIDLRLFRNSAFTGVLHKQLRLMADGHYRYPSGHSGKAVRICFTIVSSPALRAAACDGHPRAGGSARRHPSTGCILQHCQSATDEMGCVA